MRPRYSSFLFFCYSIIFFNRVCLSKLLLKYLNSPQPMCSLNALTLHLSCFLCDVFIVAHGHSSFKCFLLDLYQSFFIFEEICDILEHVHILFVFCSVLHYATEVCSAGCDMHGICDDGVCLCDRGWAGVSCKKGGFLF